MYLMDDVGWMVFFMYMSIVLFPAFPDNTFVMTSVPWHIIYNQNPPRLMDRGMGWAADTKKVIGICTHDIHIRVPSEFHLPVSNTTNLLFYTTFQLLAIKFSILQKKTNFEPQIDTPFKMSHNVTQCHNAQNGMNSNSTQQIAWHDGE